MADKVIKNDHAYDAKLLWDVGLLMEDRTPANAFTGLRTVLKDSVKTTVSIDLERRGLNKAALRSLVFSWDDNQPFDATIRMRGTKEQMDIARTYFDKLIAKNGKAGSFQASWEVPETVKTYLNLRIHSRSYTDISKALGTRFPAQPRIVSQER